MNTPMRSFIIASISISALLSCSSVKKLAIERDLTGMINKSEIFQEELMGLSVYDPYLETFLININDDKYLTPASNTKTFTLFSTMAMIGDSIPTFAYTRRPDSLIIQPLGDPTFLHPDFQGQNAIRVISDFPEDKIYIKYPEIELPTFGPGWAWDDYNYEFQPERTRFPIYGNVLTTVQTDSTQTIIPEFFADFVEFADPLYNSRLLEQNIFLLKSARPGDTLKTVIPFKTSTELTHQLLEDTLKKALVPIEASYYMEDTIYNGGTLPLYATMMLRSDNFLAEQMLYLSAVENRMPSIAAHISALGDRELVFLPDSLIWVDGSGLSRYNMVTPRNQIALYHRIYRSLEWEEIETIFPTGGVQGTIKDWYSGEEEPYVFAKTGTLRHNHCLSGFLKTSSGKTLIFSFMNNHYTRPTSEVKQQMQQVLESIRDAY